MIKYVPFLKLKQNEIQSVGVLDGGIRDQIAPMYDIPRTQKVMDEAEVIDRLRIADKELGNARGKDIDYKFFVDNFDVDDSVDLGGVPQYRAVLTMLSNYRVMPVLAFDRHPDHNVAALDFVKSRPGTDVGIRLQMIDIESYNLTKSNLQALWVDLAVAKPDNVILLIDLRIIEDPSDSKKKVERFVASFLGDFPGAKVVVSGSVVPASIAGLVATNSKAHIPREEYRLWRALNATPAFKGACLGTTGWSARSIRTLRWSLSTLVVERHRRFSTPMVIASSLHVGDGSKLTSSHSISIFLMCLWMSHFLD